MLSLGELVGVLETQPRDRVVRRGLTNPHSYRVYSFDIAFELGGPISILGMLAVVRSAIGETFEAWKGGDYIMSTESGVHVAKRGEPGDDLGPLLLEFLLSDEVVL